VINYLKRRCDTKNPEIFPPSVFTCSCVSRNNPVYSSTALRDHSFSWKHIVLSLEARSNSLCARYEEISVFSSAEVRFQFLTIRVGFVLDTVALRQVVSRVLWLPFHYYSHNVPYSSSS
jgi:hypothetical protein